jgi:hypothetical protein
MKKDFDCVAMKDAVQQRHVQQYAGMTPRQRWQAVEAALATSDDVLARKWRSLREAAVPGPPARQHG